MKIHAQQLFNFLEKKFEIKLDEKTRYEILGIIYWGNKDTKKSKGKEESIGG